MEPAEYDRMDAAESSMWWYRALHRRLIEALADAGGAVLDAGCGTGGLLAHLRPVRRDLRLIGIELTEPAARRAATKAGVPVARGSIDALPFADQAFDVAIAADLLCHAAVEPAKALSELRRVLRPAGRLIVNMPAYAWLLSAHDRQVHNVAPHHRGPACSDAAGGGIRQRPRDLLERPAAAAHGRAAQADGARSRRLGCRRLSAMDRCHIPCASPRSNVACPSACQPAARCWRPRSDHERHPLLSNPLSLCRGLRVPMSACPSSCRSIAAPPRSVAWSTRCRHCGPPAGWRSCWSTTAAPTTPPRCAGAGAARPRSRSPTSNTRATSASTTRS